MSQRVDLQLEVVRGRAGWSRRACLRGKPAGEWAEGSEAKCQDQRKRGRGRGREKGARSQRGKMGRRGGRAGCQVTRVRGEGGRVQHARAPALPAPPRVPLGPASRVAPTATRGSGRGGEEQGPKNLVPQTAPSVLHTWHPALAICSELTPLGPGCELGEM